MSLMPISAYEHVFSDFEGKTVGFVPLSGNLGDQLIHAGAAQLLAAFGISHYRIDRECLVPGLESLGIDELAISGGGNMGNCYPDTAKIREAALATGLSVTVLPQSFTDGEEDTVRYTRVFAREAASCEFDPDFVLAPDLALGFSPAMKGIEPLYEVGIFFRKDWESVQEDRSPSLCDPVKTCRNLDQFLALAGLFSIVVTDRLHFAIASLISGNTTYLMPNSYHKNRSMYETWLSGLGCRWLDKLDAFPHPIGQCVELETVKTRLNEWAPPERQSPYTMPELGISEIPVVQEQV